MYYAFQEYEGKIGLAAKHNELLIEQTLSPELCELLAKPLAKAIDTQTKAYLDELSNGKEKEIDAQFRNEEILALIKLQQEVIMFLKRRDGAVNQYVRPPKNGKEEDE